jgi:D-tyrosyl-tRNA(Tyr) deacylase
VVRALVQRVTQAWVCAPSEDGSEDGAEGGASVEVGRIGHGLVALVGATHGDDDAAAVRLAGRIAHLRVMADEAGAMNRSILDVGGGVLVVSQFTLYADTSRGRRPSFVDAAPPELAEPLIARVVDALRELGATVATGRFRTHMQVGLVNDGPVTLLLES